MSVERQTLPGGNSVTLVGWLASGAAIFSLWLMVVPAGELAGDLVSGSQHLPVAAWADWIWGVIATSFVVITMLEGFRSRGTAAASWLGLAGGVAATWAGVFLVTAMTPVIVTGSDPMGLSLGPLAAPIIGVFLTWLVCDLVRSSFPRPVD